MLFYFTFTLLANQPLCAKCFFKIIFHPLAPPQIFFLGGELAPGPHGRDATAISSSNCADDTSVATNCYIMRLIGAPHAPNYQAANCGSVVSGSNRSYPRHVGDIRAGCCRFRSRTTSGRHHDRKSNFDSDFGEKLRCRRGAD